jgi:hypothetical protein
MSKDDLNKKEVDKRFVSTVEPWEKRYWTNKFDATVDEIRGAMRATGSHGAKTIAKYLKDKD